MKTKKHSLTALLALGFLSTAMGSSLSGSTWLTIDDKTGKPRAEVLLTEHENVFSGRILKVYSEPGDTGLCSKCPGQFKDKPTKGLVFVWGLQQKGAHNWDSGHILDPKNGKIYRAKMLLKGDKLYVRGYIGVSVIGRTQIWERKQKTTHDA